MYSLSDDVNVISDEKKVDDTTIDMYDQGGTVQMQLCKTLRGTDLYLRSDIDKPYGLYRVDYVVDHPRYYHAGDKLPNDDVFDNTIHYLQETLI